MGECPLAQDTVTEYHKLGGLNNTQLFLRVLKAGKFKNKVAAVVASGERTLPVLQVAFSHCILTR